MFDSKEFGKRLMEIRKANGLTQENMRKIFGLKDASTISRYESGEVIPTIKQIVDFCAKLDISISELFENNKIHISNKNICNPFNSKTLYIYYKGRYPTSKKPAYFIFKIELIEKETYIEAVFKDINTDKIYQVGYLNCNDQMAILDFRNYKPTSPMLSFGIAAINIASHRNNIYLGGLFISNSESLPSTRKCLISTKKLKWTDYMKKMITFSNDEKNELLEQSFLTLNISAKEDYELSK